VIVRPRRAVLAAVLVLAGSGVAARAQATDLVRPVRISSLAGDVELGWELQRQVRRPEGSPATFRQEETTSLAGIHLNVGGSFLHPALFPFALDGTLRLRRSDVDTNTGVFSGSRNADASQYTARLGFLPTRAWNAQLLATRFLQDIDSTFAPRNAIARREWRFTVRHRSRGWPLTLEIGRQRAKGIYGDPRDEIRRRWLAGTNHVGERSSTRAELRWLDYRERSSAQDYEMLRATASHLWWPDGERRLVVTTTAYGYDRNGTSSGRLVDVRQGLAWTPSRDFRSRLGAEFREQDDATTGRITTRQADASLRHVLWGSLATSVDGLVQAVELPAGGSRDVDEEGLLFDYTRHLPRGVLSFSAGRRWRYDRDVSPTRQVPGELDLAWDPGAPIILDDPGLLPDTVQVTDPEGAVVYAEGLDWELVPLDGLYEVRILDGGAIAPGTPLRITWLASTSSELEVRTRVRSRAAGWRDRSGVYFHWSRTRNDPDVLSGSAGGRVERSRDSRLRAGVARPRWRVDLVYRGHRSSILPYRMRSISASWTAPRRGLLETGLHVRHQSTSFPGREDGESRFSLAGIDLRVRRTRFQAFALLEARRERILGRAGSYLLARLDLRYRLRFFEVVLDWRHRTRDIDGSGRDGRDHVRLVLRRFFR